MAGFLSTNRILLTTSELEADRQRLTEKVRRMAVSESAIISAEELIFWGINLELRADVFPNPDGGCAIAFYKDKDRVEVSIDSDGKPFGLRVEHGIGFQFEDVIPPQDDARLDEILEHLVRLQMSDKAIWKLYASSISASSTVPADDSATLYTETPQNRLTPHLLRMVEGGSQSSRWLVPALVKA